MKRKVYKKLIRDKIPEIIAQDNAIAKISTLNSADFSEALKNKLIEEAKELVLAKDKSDLISELADILELIDSILLDNKLTLTEVKKYQLDKKKKRGGFSQRLFLDYIDEN